MIQVSQDSIKKTDGNVASPKGYLAKGVHCGLRYSKKDLGIIISSRPAVSAAVYTQSHFQAAPIKVTQESLKKSAHLQAVIVNSANANACTGEQGLKDAYEMRRQSADMLGIEPELVAVSSTGVIGEYLNMESITKGISLLAETEPAEGDFEEAILTTDTVIKQTCYELTIGGQRVTIGGAAKGSGMIHPNMATMLGFVTTDACIEESALQRALREITDVSFNQITVDGDTSTNDMVLVMANGCAGNERLHEEHEDWPVFKKGLQLACTDLAKQIARDGEGATKLIEVEVNGAKSNLEAQIIAKKIVGSNLVKTAVYGTDANWGRIIVAIGDSMAAVTPEKVEIYLGGQCLFKNNEPQPFSEELAKTYLENSEVKIEVRLQEGDGKGTAWGCDLTYEYVKINASYRT
ncbi:bifunctional ornithine acetyltransferase/N-acetylglutamate synthase [Bacillus paralicheniformis]|uniref:Arginine biosynthesis bifunctional protein ArgJ n=3 Tax=Bacillus paralicheniformis TaxID=1648923 RepID=A0A7Z0WYH6_9BACI|nr:MULTISPECIES: bifunctional ornithine acetyltransferase/N-acetylglutamate synthase [Bacillus]MBC8622094.1 bifunctional ornithine acetyltransferase/N-acetylglutamate synthase [Robertmurraya crescens]KAA0840029.1 bifunctional ornithine acetyltransferase/N-acetylglutamate synthase [Bacillus paralicheniformis]KAA0841154.1 bifunctional ornithine acetyltransferase/N-acetylglutamate synthase [Bacillus paralicheniformis]KND06358.1 N-acetylglutamate synthase [Bacillus paralicheniformis]MBL7476817.1 b